MLQIEETVSERYHLAKCFASYNSLEANALLVDIQTVGALKLYWSNGIYDQVKQVI